MSDSQQCPQDPDCILGLRAHAHVGKGEYIMTGHQVSSFAPGGWLPPPPMVDYVSVTGCPNGTSYTGVVSEYPSDDAVLDMEWTCVPDDVPEEQEVSLTLTQFASILDKARKYDALLATGHRCTTCAGWYIQE